MKKLIFIFCVLVYSQIQAQKMSHSQVIEDLNFLSRNIKQYNPALPNYHPEFDRLSAQIIEHITEDSISIFDYFSKVSQICALANEGHFALGNWEDIVHNGFIGNTYAYLPIQVKIISGKLFIAKDYSNEQQMNEGDEIIAINGMTSQWILEKLLEVTPSDGEIQTYAYRKIEEGFAWRYYLYIEQAKTFEIALHDKDKKEKKGNITALLRSDQSKNFKKYAIESPPVEDRFYTLSINEDYAYLKLPSFDFRRVNKYEVKSKKLYQTIFKELKSKDVQNLVVDLRNNTGGRNEFSDDIIPFITKSSNADSYLKKTISWEGKERTYKLPKVSNLGFKGAIFVLVNGKTFSAGSSLARYLKEYGNAIIVGTETGTRYEGFAAGSQQDINLPNSQIKIGIPRYHIFYPKSTKQKTINKGLLPDYEIKPSFETYAKGQDLHLEKVLDLIKQKK